jgi:shikimate dehydrogenase
MPRAAVLGSPIAHSLSPTLHRAAYRFLGLDWDYTAIECTELEFPGFFASLDGEWRGLSLTMPLKEVVLTVVEDVSDVARAVHSANTVFRAGPDHPWQATNTDISGMENALREIGVASVTSARVLGAGATARSAIAAIAGLGGSSVVIHARRPEAATAVADLARRLGLEPGIADLTPVAAECDLVVSTLPADVAAPWTVCADSAVHTALLDASYHPWPTPLADAWHSHGSGLVASGRDMLVWQALAQVRLMTGANFDDASIVSVMRAAL